MYCIYWLKMVGALSLDAFKEGKTDFSIFKLLTRDDQWRIGLFWSLVDWFLHQRLHKMLWKKLIWFGSNESHLIPVVAGLINIPSHLTMGLNIYVKTITLSQSASFTLKLIYWDFLDSVRSFNSLQNILFHSRKCLLYISLGVFW